MIAWLSALAAPLEPGVPWTVPAREPIGATWTRASAEESGLDPEALDALFDYAFTRTGDEQDRKGMRTNALVIIRHGKLVREQYARGTRSDTALLTWSVTKSLGNALVGAAVQDGRLDIDSTACAYYAPMCANHPDVSLRDLLQMASGIHWLETYEASPIFSSVTGMLYSRGPGDMAAFTAAQPRAHAPGTHWVYSSGDSNVLSAALEGSLKSDYDDYPWTALFEPLGMQSSVYERDGAGTYVASSYWYASATDVARLGQLFLDDGVWNGQRILAPGWVRFSTTLTPAFATTPKSYAHISSNPGAQWYVNVGDPDRDLPPPWPALPRHAFGASGHWGKSVWVVPEWDLVVVRMGDDREYGCTYPGQPKCVEDPNRAFHKGYFLELLAKTVTP